MDILHTTKPLFTCPSEDFLLITYLPLFVCIVIEWPFRLLAFYFVAYIILNQVASDSGDVGGEIGGLRMGLCVPSSCNDDQITGALNEIQNR